MPDFKRVGSGRKDIRQLAFVHEYGLLAFADDQFRPKLYFVVVPLEAVDVELVLRTRGRQHLDRVIAALEAGGFRPRLAEADRSILASSGN